MPAPHQTLSAHEILRGPHIKSVTDVGDAAPVLIVEPLRFVRVGPAFDGGDHIALSGEGR